MKPFRFPLEPVRVVRQHKEQATREQYAQTLRACEDAAVRLQAASTELSGCWKSLCEKLDAGVSGHELLRARAWCNVLELRVKEHAAVLEKTRHEVDAVWQDLMLATQEREAVERLHDKRRRAYDLQLQREQQKNLDELALQLIQSPVPQSFSARDTAR